jgi:tetratricopeptide (TPR) repeat protein
LGAAFDINGESDRAAEVLCQVVDMNPDDPTPIEFLGKLLNVSPEMSIKIDQRLEQLLKSHSGDPHLNYYLGRNLLNPVAGQPSKTDMVRAENLLRTAIRLNPEFADAYFELGHLDEMEGRQIEAMFSYEHAIKLDTSQGKYHYRLSVVYRALGKLDLAAQEVRAFQRLQAIGETSDSLEERRPERKPRSPQN